VDVSVIITGTPKFRFKRGKLSLEREYRRLRRSTGKRNIVLSKDRAAGRKLMLRKISMPVSQRQTVSLQRSKESGLRIEAREHARDNDVGQSMRKDNAGIVRGFAVASGL